MIYIKTDLKKLPKDCGSCNSVVKHRCLKQPDMENALKLGGRLDGCPLFEDTGNSITALMHTIHADAKANGWWEEGERNFGELLQLVGDELAECHEEYRNNKGVKEVYYSGKGKQAYDSQGFSLQIHYESERPNKAIGAEKPEGIPMELADVVIRVLDLCGFYGIDLERAILEKMAYNRTRGHRHGGKRS